MLFLISLRPSPIRKAAVDLKPEPVDTYSVHSEKTVQVTRAQFR
jgi:hypothetical protein